MRLRMVVEMSRFPIGFSLIAQVIRPTRHHSIYNPLDVFGVA